MFDNPFPDRYQSQASNTFQVPPPRRQWPLRKANALSTSFSLMEDLHKAEPEIIQQQFSSSDYYANSKVATHSLHFMNTQIVSHGSLSRATRFPTPQGAELTKPAPVWSFE